MREKIGSDRPTVGSIDPGSRGHKNVLEFLASVGGVVREDSEPSRRSGQPVATAPPLRQELAEPSDA